MILENIGWEIKNITEEAMEKVATQEYFEYLSINMLGLINPPFSHIVYLVYFTNLGGHHHFTSVWGPHLGATYHLLHLHS